MPKVELVYDGDCPNVEAARAQLLKAFAAAQMPPRWREWRGDAEDCPVHVKGFGSPTILVDGLDVAADPDNGGACCRLYAQEDGSARGVPSVESISGALLLNRAAAGGGSGGGGSWRSNLALLPGIGLALLPNLTCPACWPAYAGFLSAIGLGFLVQTTYLLPLTAFFLAVAVAALAFRARTRRGYRPFLLGTVGALIVLIGKFHFASDPAMYAGLTLLITASTWNSWPLRQAAADCPACANPATS